MLHPHPSINCIMSSMEDTEDRVWRTARAEHWPAAEAETVHAGPCPTVSGSPELQHLGEERFFFGQLHPVVNNYTYQGSLNTYEMLLLMR